MKNRLWLLWISLMLSSCGQLNQDGGASGDGEEVVFQSENKAGKWTTDQSTAQELKSMRNTIENFTSLNKKKYENLKAYQEFGDLMKMHVERVNSYCRLDPDSKNRLCANINRIHEQVDILHGEDIEKSRAALQAVNRIFGEVDSAFTYDE